MRICHALCGRCPVVRGVRTHGPRVLSRGALLSRRACRQVRAIPTGARRHLPRRRSLTKSLDHTPEQKTESTRDAQRVRDRDRPRRRPPGRRAGGHGATDPPGGPGGRVPSAGPRRPRPALRAAARPLPARARTRRPVYGMDYRRPPRSRPSRAPTNWSPGWSTASTGSPATTRSCSSSAPTSPTPSSPTSWRSTPGWPTSSAPP